MRRGGGGGGGGLIMHVTCKMEMCLFESEVMSCPLCRCLTIILWH